jgi:hypothetical protein
MEATLATLLATKISFESPAAAPTPPQPPTLFLDRPLQSLVPAPAGVIEWPNLAPWQRPDGHHPPPLKEAPRRASS